MPEEYVYDETIANGSGLTLACFLTRSKGGDCLWLLRAELDPAARAKGPMAPAEGPWHLRDDLVYLGHSEMCVEVGTFLLLVVQLALC